MNPASRASIATILLLFALSTYGQTRDTSFAPRPVAHAPVMPIAGPPAPNPANQPQTAHSPDKTLARPLSSNSPHPLNNCGVSASFTPGNDSIVKAARGLIYFSNTSTNATSVSWYENGYPVTNNDMWGFSEPPGQYAITLVARNGACTDTATSFVYVTGEQPADRNNIKAYYGTPMDEHSNDLTAVPGGGYLLGGYSYSNIYDGYPKAMLIKTAESGCIEWSKKIASTFQGAFYKVLALNEGGYACSGYNDNLYYFMKLDASGNELWTKTYSFDGQQLNAQWASETADGGFVLVGLTGEGITVLRIDPNGNVLWTKAYVDTSPNTTWYYIGGIMAQGSDIYVTGSLYTNILTFSYGSGPPEQIYGFVLKIDDATGTTQWTKQYSMNGTAIAPRDIHGYQGALLLNSTIGSTVKYPNNTLHILDVNGTPVRSTTLSTPDLNYGVGWSTALPLNTGEIYVMNSGTETLDLQPGYAYHSFFIKLDATQNLEWSLEYGHYTGGRFFYPTVGLNNEFAAAGDEIGQVVDTYSSFSYKQMFKKLDPTGSSPYNYNCDFWNWPVTLTPETVTAQPFTWTSETSPAPQVTSTNLVLYPVYAEVRYECPEFVDSCNFMKITGTRTVCDLSGSYTYRVHRNDACAEPVKWELPPAVSLLAQTDSTITLNFSAFGNYRIGASLPFSCSPIGDSLFVTAASTSGQLNLGNDTTMCPNSSLQLHAGTKFLRYQWQNGSTDSVYTVTTPGTYTIQVADSCDNVQKDTVTVAPFNDSTFTAGPDRTKCNTDTLHLSAPPGYLNYSWSPNYNIDNLTAPQVVINPALDTAYVIKAEKTPNCYSYDTIKITVYHSPAIQLGADRSICTGDSLLLDAGAGFTQYQWNTGAATAQITVNSAGVYMVKGTTTEGCISADTMRVLSLWFLPEVNLDHSQGLCTGGTRTLTAAPGNSYLWNNGSTQSSIIVSDTGRYVVIVTDANGCRKSDSVRITTYLPVPVAFLPGDTAVCSYGKLTITPDETFRSYLWSTGSLDESITISKPGVYWLEATDNNSCVGRDTILVAKKDCMEGFYIPNAFTPASGSNNLFKPLLFGNIVQYGFAVYDRWGQLIFQSNQPGAGWDGNYQGSPRTPGVYVWVCRFTLDGQSPQIERGTVLLIR